MSDTPRTDAKENETQSGSETDLEISNRHSYYAWKFARQLERELTAACEERDWYKADSEALDFLLKIGGKETDNVIHIPTVAQWPDCPEHLRKRLEGK